MKVANKRVSWEHEPWTVVVVDEEEYEKPVRRRYYYAFNTRTGRSLLLRYSYEAALRDIPQSPYSEPWGV